MSKSKPKYDAAFNHKRWLSCKVTPARLTETTKEAKWIVANRSSYEAVERLTGVPWWFIGCLHLREAGMSANAFHTYLGNGEPLNRVTRLVPAGRGPFLTWTDGAVDAMHLSGFDKVTDWSIEHALYLAEDYNGFGYAWKGLPSPYVWGATNLQKPGKYVADGKFDASVTDSQIGVAALLQIISALVGGILPGLVNDVIKSQTSGAGVTVTPTSANTGMLSIAIGALMAGLGATSFGVDAIHTVTTIAGVAVAILSWVNHAGLIGASNANTEALVEQLLTQIASYQPPVSAVASVPEGGDALKG
jgi:lysozyme family protein